MSVAHTILAQLGGNKFLVMTGAKHLVRTENSLSFRLPKRYNGVNAVRVELNGLDLYDVTFYKIAKLEAHVIKVDRNIDCENLAPLFEHTTGLRTKLF